MPGPAATPWRVGGKRVVCAGPAPGEARASRGEKGAVQEGRREFPDEIRVVTAHSEALTARAAITPPGQRERQKSLDSERTRTTILPTLPPAVGATISRWALGASSRANIAPTTGVSSPRSMLA